MFLYKMEENWFKEQAGLKKILVKYRKIPKISPSKNKPPNQWRKKPSVKSPPPPPQEKNISPPGACTWKIVLKYKIKQSKNGKFTSNYKASPIDL